MLKHTSTCTHTAGAFAPFMKPAELQTRLFDEFLPLYMMVARTAERALQQLSGQPNTHRTGEVESGNTSCESVELPRWAWQES